MSWFISKIELKHFPITYKVSRLSLIALVVLLLSTIFASCVSTSSSNNSSYSSGNSTTGNTNAITTPYVPAVPNITIKKIEFYNILKGEEISSGTSFYEKDIRYIAAIITYDSIGSTGSIILDIKIIEPDGSISRSSASPSGYTFSNTLYVQSNKKEESEVLSGWGNDSYGAYTPGVYNYEIWSKGKKLYNASFTVRTTINIPTVPNITIAKIDFANTDTNRKVIGAYGTIFEYDTIKYIAPRITYDSIGTSGNVILNIKIIKPDGTVSVSDSSSNGYSYNYTLYLRSDRYGEIVTIDGWGNEKGRAFRPGNYICEIWYNNIKLNSAGFTVRETIAVPTIPAITITKMDFVNKDYNGTIIDSYGTVFESSTLKYLAPRITYDSTGGTGEITFNIKIIKPDGSLMTGTSSPSGYTFNTTLNVQAGKIGEIVTLISWGNERGGSYSSGTYNYEIWSKGTRLYRANFTVRDTSTSSPTANVFTTTPQRTETEVVITFNGPQGINARLYYNGQSIGTIEAEKTFRKTIPNNGVFTFKAQIGDETRELAFASRNSTTININLSARRTPSGITFTDFSLVYRIPAIVHYVNVDGLNVRDNTNANATILDVIPQDCRVEMLEEYMNSWVKIKYYGNKIGYVNGTYLKTTQPPFVITSVMIGNVNNDGRWLTNAGNTLYSSQMRYLKPVVTYDATYNEKGTFFIKIIQPNGTVFRNPSISPSGFTFSNECQVNRGNDQTLYLSGWGNSESSSYQVGEWTVEIWYNNKRLWVERVNIL